MADYVVNISSPLNLRSGLKVNYHAIYHYSYNLLICLESKRDVV